MTLAKSKTTDNSCCHTQIEGNKLQVNCTTLSDTLSVDSQVQRFMQTFLFKDTTSSKPRKMRFESGKTSTRKTENLAHLTYPHAESGMRKNRG